MSSNVAEQPLWLTNENNLLFLRRAETSLCVALQPIVSLSDARVTAVEALVRGYDKLGFTSPPELFNHAYRIGVLPQLEELLHRKSFETFKLLQLADTTALFINLDGRTTSQAENYPLQLKRLAHRFGISPKSVCVEFSEANQGNSDFFQNAKKFRSKGFSLALDDFGRGYAGLEMLYATDPEYLKIDKFFVSSLNGDAKKRLFVSAVVDLAHTLGIVVVGEGIETEDELQICRNVRCDLAQGFHVARPTLDPAAISTKIPHVASLRSQAIHRTTFVRDHVEPFPTVFLDEPISAVYELFESNPRQTIIPVLDRQMQPRGIVQETAIKPYIYSRYGRDLLANRSAQTGLQKFMRPSITVDVNVKPLNLLHLNPAAMEGLIVTESMQYLGCLSSATIINLVSTLQIGEAKKKNHLTQLPGNEQVQTYISDAIAFDGARCFAYLDFDNFKPFNDRYGFRVGDRAILLFADLLRALFSRPSARIGHIGGDDFFVGFVGLSGADVKLELVELQRRFAHEAESFYSEEDRRRGYIDGFHRDGRQGRFPLLACSVALFDLPPHTSSTPDEVAATLASVKKRAKAAPTRFATLVRSEPAASLHNPDIRTGACVG